MKRMGPIPPLKTAELYHIPKVETWLNAINLVNKVHNFIKKSIILRNICGRSRIVDNYITTRTHTSRTKLFSTTHLFSGPPV